MELLSLKGGCIGSSESSPIKMPHCWKSHVAAHLKMLIFLFTAAIMFGGAEHFGQF